VAAGSDHRQVRQLTTHLQQQQQQRQQQQQQQWKTRSK
jgi:hypothetical protein